MIQLTPEETNAIATLRRLATRWPKGLWLFAASGNLCVMRAGKHGEHLMTDGGGVDSDYQITNIDIPNDGGDW